MSQNLKKITVNTKKSYDILIGKGILDNVGEKVLTITKPCKVCVVTDSNVDRLYSKKAIDSLEKNGFTVFKFVFRAGEKSKNIKTYGKILCFLAQNEFTRTDLLLALGGGVVGDITGFVASTFIRGINYVQVPTTLLSCIDSSVGGKTAIDLKEGKNLVGAFYQPKLVLIDTATLSSLPNEIFTDGLGEAVKYAFLDGQIFNLLSKDEFDISELVLLCVDYKRRIVEEDEFEKGNRKLLNLGHTLAHGIEKLSKYKLPHGKAVSQGLKLILDASKKQGYIGDDTYQVMLGLLNKVIGEIKVDYPIEKIVQFALSDKKRVGDQIVLVMINGIGKNTFNKVDIDNLLEYLG